MQHPDGFEREVEYVSTVVLDGVGESMTPRESQWETRSWNGY